MRHVLILLISFILVPLTWSNSNLPTHEHTEHILVISIDGFMHNLLTDDRYNIPTLRYLASEGAQTSGLRTSNPSLTWPNHTTIISGVHPSEHGLIFNGKVEFGAGENPIGINADLPKGELISVVTLPELLAENNLRTAAINWPGTQGDSFIMDNWPDSPDPVGNMSEDLMWDLFDEGILVDMTNFALWQLSSPDRDLLWIEAADFIIQNRMPELLLVHLLDLDHTGHRQGINSDEFKESLETTDENIARLLSSLKESGLYEKTTILLISDHGFTCTPQTIMLNNHLKELGLLTVGENGNIDFATAAAWSTGGFGMIYTEDEAETIRLANYFESVEGIETVIAADKFEEFGLPNPGSNPHVGQIALFAKPGYGFSFRTDLEGLLLDSATYSLPRAHHGFLNTHDDMLGLFIAYGNNVNEGVVVNHSINMVDIAPKIAFLLGIEAENMTGQVLFEIFDTYSVRD